MAAARIFSPASLENEASVSPVARLERLLLLLLTPDRTSDVDVIPVRSVSTADGL